MEWEKLSRNPNITMEYIENDLKKPKDQQKPWNWEYIYMNPNLTVDFIEKHPDEEHPDYPWKWWEICENINLTMDIIDKYPDKDWNRESLS